MAVAVTTHRTRTVALVGHAGAGKTTLIERLLAETGAIERAGSVLEGTTTCDTEPEEIARKHSLSIAIAPINVGDERIDLVDTPGVADFVAEVERALAVADVAVIVVSATDGVQVQTEVVWRLAAREGIPRVIAVTKLDREGASYDGVLDSLRASFGKGVAPVELPIGEGPAFRGIADLLADAAITYDNGSAAVGEVPEEIAELEHRVREQLVEGIVIADDELMARYLDGDALSMEELEAALTLGLADGDVVPVVCVSGETGIGVDRLATLLSEIAPSRGVHGTRGDESVELPRDAEGPTVLRAFKTLLDPFIGKVTWFEVVSGTLHADDVLTSVRTRADEKLRSLQVPRGKELVSVPEVCAGDLVAIPKLADVVAGDVLAPKGFDVDLPLPSAAAPTLEIAVVPRKQGDDDKLMVALHRLVEEDAGLRVHQDDEAHQTVLTVMGDTHLAVTLERLKRKYAVEVDVEDRKRLYRQTILEARPGRGPAQEADRRPRPVRGRAPARRAAAARRRVRVRRRGRRRRDPAPVHPRGQARRREGDAHGCGHRPPLRRHQGHVRRRQAPQRRLLRGGVRDRGRARVQRGGRGRRHGLPRADLARRGRRPHEVPRRRAQRPQRDGAGASCRATPARTARRSWWRSCPPTELARYTTELRGIAGGHGTFTASFDHFAELPANLASKIAAH